MDKKFLLPILILLLAACDSVQEDYIESCESLVDEYNRMAPDVCDCAYKELVNKYGEKKLADANKILPTLRSDLTNQEVIQITYDYIDAIAVCESTEGRIGP